MRTIEKAMVNAVLARRGLCKDNTSVVFLSGRDYDEATIALYGNIIANVTFNNRGEVSRLDITLAGWNTVTTRLRLSALISELMPEPGPAGCGVSTRKGTVRLHDAAGMREIDADDWHTVTLN